MESVADGNYFRSAFEVLRVVKKLLMEWVYLERPYAFSFLATTGRKHKVYRWAARRIAAQLRGSYLMYEVGRMYWFIRVA